MLTNWGPTDLNRLSTSHHRQVRLQSAELGLVIEEIQTGWVGAIVRVEKSGGVHLVELEDSHKRRRSFPLGFGFMFNGEPVTLLPPQKSEVPKQLRSKVTASGSAARTSHEPSVARASRIWVEGTHDAELVEKIWGEDLRELGIVVEPIGGVEDLETKIQVFRPDLDARLAILVDHLVPSSKEYRIVEDLTHREDYGSALLILGHPFVDVWQVIRPKTLGISAWPVIDRRIEWKKGILQSFGLPHQSQRDIAHGWKLLLSKVTNYADLEPAFLGRVEEMLDFLTQDDDDHYA